MGVVAACGTLLLRDVANPSNVLAAPYYYQLPVSQYQANQPYYVISSGIGGWYYLTPGNWNQPAQMQQISYQSIAAAVLPESPPVALSATSDTQFRGSTPSVQQARQCNLQSEFPHLEIKVKGDATGSVLARDQETICEALRSVPSEHARTLEELTILYGDKADAEHRAQAGGRVMHINGELSEMRSLFLHELGHNVDINYLAGDRETGKTDYSSEKVTVYWDDPSIAYYSINWKDSDIEQPGTTDGDFASGYGRTNPQEDFAEGYVLYVENGPLFREWASENQALQQKYDQLNNSVFGGREYFTEYSNTAFAGSDRPWDATLMR